MTLEVSKHTFDAANGTLLWLVTAQLQKIKEENEWLKQENRKVRDNLTDQQKTRIPRPPGAVSTWKLQEAMQLSGSAESREMYAGIQVCTYVFNGSDI